MASVRRRLERGPASPRLRPAQEQGPAYLGPGWAGQYGIWFPQLRETRRTEGFKQFVRDLGFVRMWRASGDWGDFCHPLGEDDFECF